VTKKAASGAARGRHNRRDEVVEAAIEVFYEKGYASASIQDVANRVGVLKGSLYHYINSKEDLLANIFEGSDVQSEAIMEANVLLEAPAVERLRAFVYDWSLWHLRNLERASVYFNDWKQLDGERFLEVKRKRRHYERFLVDLLKQVKAEGDAAPDLDPRYVCFLILSAINGLPSWYRRRGTDSADHISGVYAGVVVAMVCGTSR
jgi:AcrR family transcriptional regulator